MNDQYSSVLKDTPLDEIFSSDATSDTEFSDVEVIARNNYYYFEAEPGNYGLQKDQFGMVAYYKEGADFYMVVTTCVVKNQTKLKPYMFEWLDSFQIK